MHVYLDARVAAQCFKSSTERLLWENKEEGGMELVE